MKPTSRDNDGPWDLSTFFDMWLRRTVKPTER
jgi:hypothetical protein